MVGQHDEGEGVVIVGPVGDLAELVGPYHLLHTRGRRSVVKGGRGRRSCRLLAA